MVSSKDVDAYTLQHANLCLGLGFSLDESETHGAETAFLGCLARTLRLFMLTLNRVFLNSESTVELVSKHALPWYGEGTQGSHPWRTCIQQATQR